MILDFTYFQVQNLFTKNVEKDSERVKILFGVTVYQISLYLKVWVEICELFSPMGDFGTLGGSRLTR